MENGAFQFQLFAQIHRVGKRAVVRQRQRALDVVDHHGLRVQPRIHAHRAIAHMADRHAAHADLIEPVAVENIVHQAQFLVAMDHAAVVHRDAAAFLAAMLQRVQRVIAIGSDIAPFAAVNAKYAAFLVYFIKHAVSPYSPSNRRRIS